MIVTATVHFLFSESRAVNPPDLQILRINRKGMINDIIMGYSRKIYTPMMEGMRENLMGGGVNGSGNPDRRGALNLNIYPPGSLSISLMFQSLQSISFQEIALPFNILLFFQTTDLLPHLF